MKHSQRAIMTSVDHLNENFEVKVNRCPTAFEDDSDSSVLFSLPKDKFSDYFEVGDLIEFKKGIRTTSFILFKGLFKAFLRFVKAFFKEMYREI